jgi:hypothetical protein
MMQLTELERQGLSEDEIALLADGLEEDGTPVEEGSATAAPDDELDEDPADEPQAAEAKPVAKPQEPEPAADEQTQEETTAAQPVFVPQYSAEVPADAKEQMALLRAEERAAFAKLMDGEEGMDTEAYNAIRDRTDAAIDDLKTRALTASIFRQATEQAATQRAREEWDSAKTQCFAQFKADGQDYTDSTKPGLLAAYNHHLKALGANPANEDKNSDWFLREAHRLTRADLGITSKPSANTVQMARGVDKSSIPPTLSRVPPAADASIAGDEFAHLANMSGAALEKAIAGMTPEQLDRYLS